MSDTSDPLRDQLDLEVVAASLRMGREGLAGYLSGLAAKLERVVPGQVVIERAGLLRRPAVAIRVRIGAEEFAVSSREGPIRCTVASIVRDVVIKTDELELDAWLSRLSQALVSIAAKSQQTRAALERIVR